MTRTAERERDKAERETESPAPPSREEFTGRPDNYPRMVFRPGHMCRVMGQYDVDYMTVGSDKALQDALDHGWFLDPERMGEMEPKTEADKRRKQEQDRQRDKEQERRRERDSDGGDKRQTGRGLKGGSGERDTRETNPEHVYYDPYKDPGNPRPGEPDNAPFRNTPYDEPQTGDLPDPPTSPAEIPEIEPIPADEATAPGEIPGEGTKPDQGLPGSGVNPDLKPDNTLPQPGIDNTLPPEGGELPGKPVEPPLGESRKGDTGRDSGSDKGAKDAPKRGGTAEQDDKALRDKGAPPGSRKG